MSTTENEIVCGEAVMRSKKRTRNEAKTKSHQHKSCKKCQRLQVKFQEERELMRLKISRMKQQLHTLQACVKERNFEIIKVNEAALLAQQQNARTVQQLADLRQRVAREQNEPVESTKPVNQPTHIHFRPRFEF